MVKTVLDEEDKAKILSWIQSHGDDENLKWGDFKKFLKFMRDVLYAEPSEW